MSSDATIVTGRRVAERYRLAEPRGDGAWAAVDERLRRNVVVHLLPAGADADAKAHFTAEARSLAKLNHRNIVCTYDTGVDGDGTGYRVDELPAGEPVDLHAVPDGRRASYAAQLARALNDAHAQGLVHGSLTSSSVLADDEGRLRVGGLRLPRAGEDTNSLEQADTAAVIRMIVALAPAGPSPLREVAIALRNAPPTSMTDVCDSLAQLPNDDAELDDDAGPARTPPTGVPTAPPARRRVLLLGIAVALAAAVLVAVILPAQRANDFGGTAQDLQLTASSFDPEASPPTENEAQARLAVDGNPASTWSTERYRSANFGSLKDGLGLVLRTTERAKFEQLVITSPTSGWELEIYVANAPAAELSGWGEPLATAAVQGQATLDLEGAEGTAILVWITDPGPDRQVRIGEITVRGRM